MCNKPTGNHGLGSLDLFTFDLGSLKRSNEGIQIAFISYL